MDQELLRYESINNSLSGDLEFNCEKLSFNNNQLDLIGGTIPSFIVNNLDELTEDMSNFYNEVKFPNYDDFDDYASLYDKGMSNLFTQRLDRELNYASKVLELGCGTGQLSLFLARGNRQVYGVDISNGSLLVGEKFRRDNKVSNAYFMKMDVFDLNRHI